MFIKNHKENKTFKIFYAFHEQAILTSKLVLKTYRSLQDKNITRWVEHYLINLDLYNLINIPFKAVNFLEEAEHFYEVKVYNVGTKVDLRRHGVGMAFKATSIVKTLGRGIYALGEKGYLPVYKTLKILNLPLSTAYDFLFALYGAMKAAKYKLLLQSVPSTSTPFDKRKLTVIRSYLKKNIYKKNLTSSKRREKCRNLKDRTVLVQEKHLKEGTSPKFVKLLRRCRQLSKEEFFDKKNQKKILNTLEDTQTLLKRKIRCKYVGTAASVVQGIATASIIFSFAPPLVVASALWTTFVVETYLGTYELFYINRNLKTSS